VGVHEIILKRVASPDQNWFKKMEEIKNVDGSVIDLTKTDEELEEEKRLEEEKKKEEELNRGQNAPTDIEVELAITKERLAKAEEERDNYKTGLLKEKGKITEDELINDENRETVNMVIDKRVKIALLDSQIVQDKIKERELTERLLKENKELRVALKSKSQPTNTGQGSGSDEDKEIKKDFFSKEQEAEIFAKFPNIAKNPKGLEMLKANILNNRTK